MADDTSISPTSNMDVNDTVTNTASPNGPDSGSQTPIDATEAPSFGPNGPTPPTTGPKASQPQGGQPSGNPQGKPVDMAEAPSFGPKNSGNPAPAPAPTTDGSSSDPQIQKASRFYKFAETLAGGPRYKESVDWSTGQMKRDQVPLSKSDLGIAIALEAVGGALAGFSQTGPGATGKAAAAGYQQGLAQSQQVQQQQDANANADFARHAQVLQTNMRLRQNAVTVGKMNGDAQDKYLGQFQNLIDIMTKDHPDQVLGVVNYSDFPKYNVTTDTAIPYRRIPRLDGTTGEQVTDENGVPQWDLQYLVVKPGFKAGNLLSKEDRDYAAKMNMRGFADSSGNPTKLPQDLPMSLWQSIDQKSQIAGVKLAEDNVNNYNKLLDAHESGASTPIWGMFKDTDGLAKFIEEHEGNKPGSRADRNKNPGNLVADASWHGPTDTTNLAPEQKGVGYRVYNSYDEGHQALVHQLNLDMQRNPNITPENYFKKYDATDPAAYAAAARKAAGVPMPTASEPGTGRPDINLAEAIKKDPTLPDALSKFQPYLAGSNNLESALKQMMSGTKDPAAVGKIMSLYGGWDDIHKFDQQNLLMAQDAKKRQDAQDYLDREAANRQNKKNESYEANLAAAKSIAGDPNDPGSGDMSRMEDIFSMKTDQRSDVYKMAKEINPNFNPQNAKLKGELWNGFASPSGKEYQQVKSFNTLLDHIGGALEASNNFHNSTYGEDINKPINDFKKKYAGDANLANLITAIQPVKSEFMTFLNANHALTEHDKNAGDDLLNWNMSPAVLEQNLKTFADTAANRAVETNNGWKNVFGRDYPDLLSPSAVETLRKLGPDSNAYKTLANMQTGGSILGSSDGRGIAGQTVSQVLSKRTQTGIPQGVRPAQGNEQPVWLQGGKFGGYTTDGKSYTLQYSGQ